MIKKTILNLKALLTKILSNIWQKLTILLGLNKNRKAISFLILVEIAWSNLVHKKLRTFLTVFGVTIGIGAIFLLLSFGIGLQRLVTNQVVGNQSIKSVDVTTPNSKIIKLNQEVLTKMKNLPHVVQIGSVYNYAGSLKVKGSEIDTIVYGVDRSYQQMSNLSVVNGRLLKPDDSKAIVISTSSLKQIGMENDKAVIGKTISLRIPLHTEGKNDIQHDFTIVGVIDAKGSNEVYIPSGIISAAGIDVLSQVKIEVDDIKNVKPLRGQVESLGFQTTSPVDTVTEINQIFKFFNIILAGFGAIGMIVAVLGMFNTLTISLLERTREIGLMMALGGRNRDIRLLFIFEAVLLSIVGALIGIISAAVIGQIINGIMNALARSRGVSQGFQIFALPWWLVLGTLSFMVLVGLIVVFLPARRASRISPIDALRRE